MAQRPELAAAMHEILAAWHTRQLQYYSAGNRPIKSYLGRFEAGAGEMRGGGKGQAVASAQ